MHDMSRKGEVPASIVSIVPFPINEEKHGIYPGFFQIPASVEGIPEILVIGESIHFIEVDVDKSISVTNPSYKVADSVVKDYIESMLGASGPNNSGPGIFWAPGRLDVGSVYKTCAVELKAAQVRQHNWFLSMVSIADDDWEKTHQHRVITDMQRFAAKSLNLDRPWIMQIKDSTNSIKCPGCGTQVSSGVVVCAICKCILDKEKYSKLSFAG